LIFGEIMEGIMHLQVQENKGVSIHISEDKVLPLPLDVKILESTLRERGCMLVDPDDFERQYAQNVFFRAGARKAGWILTSQTGIERMEYRELDTHGTVTRNISWNAFIGLSPENRSVRLPGINAVLASNACFEGDYDCLVLRADVYKPRPVRYAYTFSTENRSRRAEALICSLKRR